MKRKKIRETAGGGGFPRFARVMTLVVLMLSGLNTGATAADVLYATVSGTAMTLKYGALPASGATEFTGTSGWNNDFRSTVTTATVDESCKNYAGNNLAHLFYYMQKLTTIEGLANLNTANVISTRNMFNTCKALTSLDLSAFNTEKVTNMGSMFSACQALTSLDLSAFNTAAVTVMSFMFYNCTALKTITVSSGWNTDKVTSSDDMFAGCTKLPNFDANKKDKTNAHTGEGGYLTKKLVPFTATLAEGTEDAERWTVKAGNGTAQAFPIDGLSEGDKVVVCYSGNRRVKSVTATWTPVPGGSDEPTEAEPTWNTPKDLSTLTADYEAQDGDVLKGTLGANVKITVKDGATIKLDGVNITNLGNGYDWAGINCPGDAIIILADGSTNTVCAGRDNDGYNNYPGIWIAPEKALTIKGKGSLTVYSNEQQPGGAGIGGGYQIGCGNIAIKGGTITATGGQYAAGIGGGGSGSCGNISITGGIVTATGGYAAAGIGGGVYGPCGTIKITDGVTSVTATKGTGALYSIGAGTEGTCGTVTIGEYDMDAVSESPYTYPEP